MKKQVFLLIFLLLVSSIFAVNAQKIETRPGEGSQVLFQEIGLQEKSIAPTTVLSRDDRLELLWQTSDPAAIAEKLAVSQTTGQSFVAWCLNNERASLYQDNPIPVWEHAVNNGGFNFPIIVSEDGSALAITEEGTLKVFDPSSSTPIWEYTTVGEIRKIAFNTDGTIIFLGIYDSVQGNALVESYNIGNPISNWSIPFAGVVGNLVTRGDDSTLIFTQYGGGNSNMWVLDSSDGSVIFQGPEYNQNPPAISYDATYIVNGDYAGYVTLYKFNPNLETYEEEWNYHVDGGGSNEWIGGMAISADGSTIACGTLTFLTSDYNGQIYLFNNYSPNPVWVYEDVGDYAIDIDMDDDGSLIAAACWGPLDNSTSDFFLFRKQSNIPVFEINTPGSLASVDMASDGSFCTTGGKAVHMRIMGSGGNLYSVDCDLGGGFITGTVNLDGIDDNSGVKVEISALNGYYDYTDYDGNYNLDNVPEGTYNVEFSKIGYGPGNIPNVVVVEEQTNDLGEITLYSIGSPPENLTASQATGITVELNWDEPIAGDPLGYNIYRKVYEQEPYPETPLVSVGPGELSYIDDQALPLVNYYYVVTTELTGGLQSPYSNEVEGWISTGFVVDEISVYEGTTPVIDGEISAGEWDDAFMMDTSDFWGTYDNTIQPIGSVIGYFKMNTDMTELYVAYINYNDTVLEDHDEVALYIDDNNDGTYPPVGEDSEGNYWAAYYAAGNELKYRPIYETGGVGTTIYLTDPQLEVSVDEGYLVYEFMVPIGTETWEINPSAQNESSLAIFVLDDNAPDPHGFDGWWPLDNINLFNPTDYGTMTFGAVPQTPPAPENISLVDNEDGTITISWDMSAINDFDHFNIYLALDGGNYEIIDETVGTCYIYTVQNYPALHSFYITTVNQTGMESEPSDIVEFLSVHSDELPLPVATQLSGNYPNPFNPETTILFTTENTEKNTELIIYNLKGQTVKTLINEKLPAGNHQVIWNGKDNNGKQVASGIYFYKMKSGNYNNTKKMLLLK